MAETHPQAGRDRAQALYDQAHQNLRNGALEPAIAQLEAALAQLPHDLNIRTDLGRAYALADRKDDAERQYKDVLQRSPNFPATLDHYAAFLFKQGRLIESIACLHKLCEMEDAKAMTWFRLMFMLESVNRIDEAAEALNKAKRRFSESRGIKLMEAKILRRQGQLPDAMLVLEPVMQQLSPDSFEYSPFYFEMGQLYDQADQPGCAFDAFTYANTTVSKGPGQSYDNRRLREALLRITQEITPDILPRIPLPHDGLPAPVFLVGFPRSGTTLLDQILSSHPGIRVTEERPVIGRISGLLSRQHNADTTAGRPEQHADGLLHPSYPSLLASLRADDVARLRKLFYAEHGVDPSPQKVFVDKMPLNLLHTTLILRLFPDAKFILALRHPCDSVLSCFMQEFQLTPFMARFLDLQDAASFYDEAFSLWERCTSVFNPAVRAVRYEDVVADFRPTINGLLNFLGLEWDDSVLEYDKTAKEKGRINTPSYHQVTQKIYTRSSGRWLKYRKHLESVLPTLAPHAERYGYSMDAE